MSDSPFHGIFSAFSAGQAERVSSSKREDTQTRSNSSGQNKKKVITEVEEVEPATAQTGKRQSGQIAVDIFEHDGYYIVRAPIAGVKLSDLDIEVDGKTLTIIGHREESEEIASDQYFLKECFWGEFSRSISLPIVIDPKRVKATFSKDGILKVYVPKTEEKVKIVRVSEN